MVTLSLRHPTTASTMWGGSTGPDLKAGRPLMEDRMKREQLSVGMVVAVKRGPRSRSLERAIVLSVEPAELYGKRGIPLAFAGRPGRSEVVAMMARLEDQGVDRTTAHVLARQMTRPWRWETRLASLIAGSWDAYRAQKDAERHAAAMFMRDEDERWDLAIALARQLTERLGVPVTARRCPEGSFEGAVRLKDLQKVADRLREVEG